MKKKSEMKVDYWWGSRGYNEWLVRKEKGGNLGQSKVKRALHILEIKTQGELNRLNSLKFFTMPNNNKFFR